jgi:hypothetical protein
MANETPEQLRKSAKVFALEAYQKMKNHRAYALDEQGKVGLAALARAMFVRRIEEGRSGTDAKPTNWEEFFSIIDKLAAAGANILQKRPGDPKPPPKPWRDPVTGEPLPNPFAKNTSDLKARTVLVRRDPELAEHYKAMASDPYGTIAKYQDAEAARAAMEQIPYGESEHAVNPFRTNDLAAQSAFVKNAPPGLAEFCKNEAKPVEIPLFGKNRNLTVESALAKDPATFALLKVVQQIRETWRAEDARAALAKRAAAEAEIKRLAEVAA